MQNLSLSIFNILSYKYSSLIYYRSYVIITHYLKCKLFYFLATIQLIIFLSVIVYDVVIYLLYKYLHFIKDKSKFISSLYNCFIIAF